MKARRRLLCSLPVIATMLLAVGQSRGAEGAPDPQAPVKLIDVNDAGGQAATLKLDDLGPESGWTMSWNDLDVTDDDPPLAGVSSIEGFSRVNLRQPQAPPIIAAPLPPAILTGLLGLAGVYAYKRRHRMR